MSSTPLMLMMLMLLLLGHCIDAETPCDDASAAGAFIQMRLRQKAADKPAPGMLSAAVLSPSGCLAAVRGDESSASDSAAVDSGIWQIQMRRESKSNAMGSAFWTELPEMLKLVCSKQECRCVVLRGLGKNFCAGLDLNEAASYMVSDGEDPARDSYRRLLLIRQMQFAISSVANCPVPVIACVQGACVGGGVDLITACDIRVASADAWFSIKEVDVGIVAGMPIGALSLIVVVGTFELMSAADLGTVQRMPRAVANRSWFNEMMYTGRRFDSEEARANGLLSSVHPTPASAFSHAMQLATSISKKSPLVIRGIKEHIRFSEQHSISEGLEHAAVWNAGMLSAPDIGACMSAGKHGTPMFSKL